MAKFLISILFVFLALAFVAKPSSAEGKAYSQEKLSETGIAWRKGSPTSTGRPIGSPRIGENSVAPPGPRGRGGADGGIAPRPQYGIQPNPPGNQQGYLVGSKHVSEKIKHESAEGYYKPGPEKNDKNTAIANQKSP
ncbi:hypothetical protein ACH5RR_020411 [Cinchona calisaya]|uniref:Glycine-rich protein n=1 Tax=Cinchona calisaya TaxID=153742 RepID=A0ABD2ZHD0_9GENT